MIFKRSNLLLILVLNLLTFPASAQKLIKYYAPSGLIGVIDKKTKRSIIPPVYNEITEISDSLIVVRTYEKGYAVVDLKGNIIVPFSKNLVKTIPKDKVFFHDYRELFIERYDTILKNNYGYEAYLINRQRVCVQMDYYPCPAWKDTITYEEIYQKYLHEAFKYHSKNNLDSALFFCLKAINSSPNKSYPYYLRAILSEYDRDYSPKKEEDFQNKAEIDSILFYLNRADTFAIGKEKTYIKNAKLNYYSKIIKSKSKVKEIQKSSTQVIRMGWFIIASPSYNKGFEMELGFGNGELMTNSKFDKVVDGFMWFGLSYNKNFAAGLDGYKLYLLSFQQKFCAGIYPIVYTDYDRAELILKPEIGIGFNFGSISTGYNLHVSGDRFNTINNININIKFFIPIKTENGLND
jgi:hypothetical protein